MNDIVSESPDVRRLLSEIVAAQDIGPPYNGWDISALKAIKPQVDEYLFNNVQTNGLYTRTDNLDEATVLLAHFAAYASYNGSWNLTYLNYLSRHIRAHLDLPSVESVHPELKEMKDKAKQSPFFKNLNERFRTFVESSRGDVGFGNSAFKYNPRSLTLAAIPQDDLRLDTSNSVLPEEMLKAGEDVMMANRNIPPEASRDVAVEVFRAMCEAGKKIQTDGHNNGTGDQ